MLKTSKSKNQTMGFFAKLLRSRNVIIVSAGEVKHYPLSTKVLLGSTIAFTAILSWVSYTTGSYLATASLLAEKDRKIAITSRTNRMMEEQYALLKSDLSRLQTKSDDLTDMDKFVVQQHAATMDAIFSGKAAQADDDLDGKNLSHLSQNLLQQRIDYLEGMVDQLEGDRADLLSDLRLKTQDQISLYQDIIEATGLNMAKLMQRSAGTGKLPKILETDKNDLEESADASGNTTDKSLRASPAAFKPVTQEKPKAPMAPSASLSSPDTAGSDDFKNQGGPYIPEDFHSFREEKESLMDNVDHMLKLGSVVEAIPLARPMDTTQITSRFGRRVDPITKRWATHRGIDFVGMKNRNVMATADGLVITAGREGAYGQMIEIDHGYGISTRYAHLGGIKVSVGQRVKAGDIIGLQGNSGRSTGSHLHYEVRFMHSALNPAKFIEAGNYVQK